MKTLYIAIKIILKQKWINLILIITIISSIYYLVPTFTQIIHYSSSINSLKQLDTNNAYYLYRSPFFGWNNSELWKKTNETIHDSNNIIGYANYYNLSDDTSPYDIMSYNQELIRRFNPKLNKGIWLSTVNESSKYIPAIVGNNTGLSYNEIFQLPLTRGEKVETLTCKVIGIFEKDCMILDFSSDADDTYFTSDILLKKANNAVVIPLNNMILDYLGEFEYLADSKGGILYSTSKTNSEKIVQEIGYAGNVTNLTKGSVQFYEQSEVIITAMGACWGIFFLVTMLCMISSNVLLNVNLKRIYTIYYISGMSLTKRKILDIVRVGLLIFTCSIFSYLYLLRNILTDNCLSIKYKHLLFWGLTSYVSIIYIPVSIWFSKKQKKWNILDSICQFEP